MLFKLFGSSQYHKISYDNRSVVKKTMDYANITVLLACSFMVKFLTFLTVFAILLWSTQPLSNFMLILLVASKETYKSKKKEVADGVKSYWKYFQSIYTQNKDNNSAPQKPLKPLENIPTILNDLYNTQSDMNCLAYILVQLYLFANDNRGRVLYTQKILTHVQNFLSQNPKTDKNNDTDKNDKYLNLETLMTLKDINEGHFQQIDDFMTDKYQDKKQTQVPWGNLGFSFILADIISIIRKRNNEKCDDWRIDFEICKLKTLFEELESFTVLHVIYDKLGFKDEKITLNIKHTILTILLVVILLLGIAFFGNIKQLLHHVNANNCHHYGVQKILNMSYLYYRSNDLSKYPEYIELLEHSFSFVCEAVLFSITLLIMPIIFAFTYGLFKDIGLIESIMYHKNLIIKQYLLIIAFLILNQINASKKEYDIHNIYKNSDVKYSNLSLFKRIAHCLTPINYIYEPKSRITFICSYAAMICWHLMIFQYIFYIGQYADVFYSRDHKYILRVNEQIRENKIPNLNSSVLIIQWISRFVSRFSWYFLLIYPIVVGGPEYVPLFNVLEYGLFKGFSHLANTEKLPQAQSRPINSVMFYILSYQMYIPLYGSALQAYKQLEQDNMSYKIDISKYRIKSIDINIPDLYYCDREKRATSEVVFQHTQVSLSDNNMVILGKSGTGKSTLYNIITGGLNQLLKRGYVVFNMETENGMKKVDILDTHKYQLLDKILYFPQKMIMFENSTIEDMFKLFISDISKQDMVFALELGVIYPEIGVHRKIKTLSGGEKQRIRFSICIAKIIDAYRKGKQYDMIIMDEYYVGLNKSTRIRINELLFNYLRSITFNVYSEQIKIYEQLIIQNHTNPHSQLEEQLKILSHLNKITQYNPIICVISHLPDEIVPYYIDAILQLDSTTKNIAILKNTKDTINPFIHIPQEQQTSNKPAITVDENGKPTFLVRY